MEITRMKVMNETPSHKLTQEAQRNSLITKKFPEWFPVFGSHVIRIGLFRTFIGGVPMYLSLPIHALFHLFCLYIFSNLILQPLLKLKKLQFKNYIIIDRHKIVDLPWFDRINCVYCGYANGLATFFEARLDQVELWKGELSFSKKIILFFGLVIYIPFSYLHKLDHLMVYDFLVSRPLGLNRLSKKDAALQLKSPDNNTNIHTGLIYKIIHNERIFSLKFTNSLEQIESSWCPIKHYDERSEVVYPRHHENFLAQHEIQKMKEILQRDGTVSQKKPYR
jgi:hypothetical protein